MIARVTESGMEPLTNSFIGNSPIGTIVSYAGTSIPAGYLLCNGSTFESDTYPELTALLGGTTTPSITDTTPLGYKIIKALMITGGSVGSVADVVTVPNIEIGTVFAFAGTVCPEHYLPCDGSEFDTTTYSELYNILGSNKLPDYREVVLVGAGTNTTDSIETHDTYTVGQFKDDQLQDHRHMVGTNWKEGTVTSQETPAATAGTLTNPTSGTRLTLGVDNGRAGTTTHGKQKGVLYIIKADREDMTDLVTKVDEIAESVWGEDDRSSNIEYGSGVTTGGNPQTAILYGRMCYLNLDIYISSGTITAERQLMTGLPKAAQNFTFYAMDISNNSAPISVMVTTHGLLIPGYNPNKVVVGHRYAVVTNYIVDESEVE